MCVVAIKIMPVEGYRYVIGGINSRTFCPIWALDLLGNLGNGRSIGSTMTEIMSPEIADGLRAPSRAQIDENLYMQ
jgi:hypothetical protein